MTKKFEIELACKIVCNWKIKLEANSEEEAKALAVEEYRHNPQKGEIIELDGIDEDFDLDEETGIYCEEVEDSTEDYEIQDLDKLEAEDEIDIDSRVDQLLKNKMEEQKKRGEKPDALMAMQDLYHESVALQQSKIKK